MICNQKVQKTDGWDKGNVGLPNVPWWMVTAPKILNKQFQPLTLGRNIHFLMEYILNIFSIPAISTYLG